MRGGILWVGRFFRCSLGWRFLMIVVLDFFGATGETPVCTVGGLDVACGS